MAYIESTQSTYTDPNFTNNDIGLPGGRAEYSRPSKQDYLYKSDIIFGMSDMQEKVEKLQHENKILRGTIDYLLSSLGK